MMKVIIMAKFMHGRLKMRRRFAFWPVELWGHGENNTGVEFKGVYLWWVYIVETETILRGWKAYEQYQDLRDQGQ